MYVSLPEIDLPFSRGKRTSQEDAEKSSSLSSVLEMIRRSNFDLICVD